MVIRIWERPYFELALPLYTQVGSFYEFKYMSSAIWYVLISMLTVGYGNIVASTPLGRTFILFAIIVGSFLLALLVGLIMDWFDLTEEKIKALHEISERSFAVKSITAALQYNVAKQKRLRFYRNKKYRVEESEIPSISECQALKEHMHFWTE